MLRQLVNLRAACAAAVVLSVPSFASAQTSSVLQEKVFYNQAQTDSSTRVSGNAADTIYFMQPELFHKGYGTMRGFRVLLQDQDYRTNESVNFGAVRYGNNGQPDASQAGLVVASSVTLNFPQPTSGTVSAALWTITLAQPATVPSELGLRLVLPAPKSATDSVGVHTQRDTTTRLTQSFRQQWTYALSGASNVVPYFGRGSTLRYGAVYTEPVAQIFVKSTLYGASQDLFGPEALHPNVTAGDQVGWAYRGAAFANQAAVLLIGAQNRATPLQTGLGTLFLQVPLGLVQLPLVLDATGAGTTATVLPPAKVKLRTQAVFVHLGNGTIRASDASGFDAQ